MKLAKQYSTALLLYMHCTDVASEYHKEWSSNQAYHSESALVSWSSQNSLFPGVYLSNLLYYTSGVPKMIQKIKSDQHTAYPMDTKRAGQAAAIPRQKKKYFYVTEISSPRSPEQGTTCHY